jgi:hypothetical protein
MLIPAPFPLKQHQKSNFGPKIYWPPIIDGQKGWGLEDFAGLCWTLLDLALF